uniref:tryptase n=2 Tax=Molossus molossus TaxID=27622 RepID=A0A7J8G1Q7_MOLMO|nr:hypothetical protein HJG59_014915 [Molossus molossus]
MASAGAGGAGPGCWAADALAVALLCPLLLHAQAAGSVNNACGKPLESGKILGGQNAPDLRWPWQASLLYRGLHICGAALIDAFWVVSAAHCFQKSQEPSDYQILLGYHKLQQPTEHSLIATVYRVFVHSDFNKHYFLGSDIALLQLHLAVKFTSHILPVCLPEITQTVPTSTSCWVTGWGMLTETEYLGAPLQLQEGEVGILSNDICKVYFQTSDTSKNNYSVHEDMLCAGDLNTGKAICRGDSGGPLACKLMNIWYLIGISSWSLPCQQPVSPSVFTRLTHFTSWILEKQSISPNPDPAAAPPRNKPPAIKDFNSTGTAHKPRSCTALVVLQTSPVLLMSLRAR